MAVTKTKPNKHKATALQSHVKEAAARNRPAVSKSHAESRPIDPADCPASTTGRRAVDPIESPMGGNPLGGNSLEVAKHASSVESAYDVLQPEQLLTLAKELKRFIKECKLISTVQGREHVRVEGWQYLGTCIGVMAIVERVENLSTDQHIKYQVTVLLKRVVNDQIIGRGVSVCSTQESGRRKADEYAIQSMAQTRAIGKAYRNTFGWIIKAAGYETTPAEEVMDGSTARRPVADAGQSAGGGENVSPDPSSPPPLASESQTDTLKRLLSSHVFEGDQKAEQVLSAIKAKRLRKDTASAYISALIDNKKTGEIGVLTMRKQLDEAVNLPEFPASEQVEILALLPTVWKEEQYEELQQRIQRVLEDQVPF